MQVFISYKRLNPDTVAGDAIIITQTFSSFDKAEIDELEKKLKESIKSGLLYEYATAAQI